MINDFRTQREQKFEDYILALENADEDATRVNALANMLAMYVQAEDRIAELEQQVAGSSPKANLRSV